jgi:hypothetical protein
MTEAPGAARIAPVSRSAPPGRGVAARVLAVVVLAAAVAVIAALGGYTHGRGSVDADALQAKAYATGHAAGLNDAHRSAARAKAVTSASPVGRGGSHVITGPSAEMRAQLRRAYAAGASAAAFEQRAHGRALGASAALGNFPDGWATGRYYIVRLSAGSTLTGGRPAVASRIGPLSNGQRYMACRGGQEICPAGGR